MEVVTIDNVFLGMKVVRGPDWCSKKWKLDKCDGVAVPGTIIGFINDDRKIIGLDARANKYNKFIVIQNEPRWCAVVWDNGQESVYPIGAEMERSRYWSGGNRYALQNSVTKN